MNVIGRIVIGGLAGWLTGKAVEVEDRVKVVKEGHVLDAIYGIAGAMVGEYLFFGSSSAKAMRSAILQPPSLARSRSWE